MEFLRMTSRGSFTALSKGIFKINHLFSYVFIYQNFTDVKDTTASTLLLAWMKGGTLWTPRKVPWEARQTDNFYFLRGFTVVFMV